MTSYPIVDGGVDQPVRGPDRDAGAEPAAAFLMKLARALHAYGMPAHRLEQALEQVSEQLAIEGQYLVTPTSIVASIGPAARPQTYLLRVNPGQVDLAKLSELHKLVAAVAERRIGLEEAAAQVDALKERPPAYSRLVTVSSFGLASAAAAVFFDGGWGEVIAAGAVGLVIGLLVQIAARAPRFGLVLPAAAGLAAVLTTGLVQQSLAGTDLGVVPFIPIFAGLIILIPGLTLTIAVNELAQGHLVSGTARFVGALVTFLQIAFGVALGQKLVERFPGVPTEAAAGTPDALPLWMVVVALPVTAAALTVLFRAHKRHYPLILLAASLSFAGARLGTRWLGPELGVLLAAWLVGWVGHLSARHLRLPSAVTILPGILLLVPGSLGFRSLSSLLANDVLSGIEAGFTMVVIAFSLVTGLLIASLTSRSREAF